MNLEWTTLEHKGRQNILFCFVLRKFQPRDQLTDTRGNKKKIIQQQRYYLDERSSILIKSKSIIHNTKQHRINKKMSEVVFGLQPSLSLKMSEIKRVILCWVVLTGRLWHCLTSSMATISISACWLWSWPSSSLASITRLMTQTSIITRGTPATTQ